MTREHAQRDLGALISRHKLRAAGLLHGTRSIAAKFGRGDDNFVCAAALTNPLLSCGAAEDRGYGEFSGMALRYSRGRQTRLKVSL